VFLTVDNQAVFAATGGKDFDAAKPTVIFIHGAGMDHTCWQLQSRWFAWHGWSVLAIDLPGHGRSAGKPLGAIIDMAGWIGRLMDSAELETATLVGHSMGAIIAMEAATTFPARIDGLALLGASAAMPVHPTLLDAAKNNPTEAYLMMTAWSHGKGAKMGRNKVPGIWMTGNALAVFERNLPGVLFTDLSACADWATGPDTAVRIGCPVQVITATQDMMTPARKGRELAGLITTSQLTELDDCGHMMMAETPDAVLDALIGCLGPG